jgi:hypothetical protein
MAKCPVCETEYIEEQVQFCSICAWDLNPYPLTFQLPEAFLGKEKTKLAWAKQMWKLYLEQVEKLERSQEKLLQQTEPHTSIKAQTTQASAQIWHQVRLCLLDIARSGENTDNKKLEELMLYLEEYPITNWEWVKILDNTTSKNNVNIIGATYRALLTILGNIPVTEWLETLEKESSHKNKIAALNIQKSLVEISSKRDNDTVYQDLTKHLKIGIIEILLQCQSKIDNSIYQNIEWLLSESNSVWIEHFNNYAKTLVYRLVHRDKNGDDQFYQQLLTKLNEREKYQQRFGHYRVLPQYRNLAQLFARLGHYSLSAFFYQLSSGRVPADIYDRAEVMIIPTIKDEKSSGLTKNTKNWFQLF